jgi:ATP-dependent Lon protease
MMPIKLDKLIGVLAQKDVNIEEPEPKDLCKTGTVARIVKLIKMPDGGTTIIIQGKKRFELQTMISEDPYFKATIKVLETMRSLKLKISMRISVPLRTWRDRSSSYHPIFQQKLLSF